MRAVTEFRFQYEDEDPRPVRMKVDLTGHKWSSLRNKLVAQSAPTLDPSPALWIFSVDGIVMSFMDANNKRINSSFGATSLVRLQYRGPPSVVKVSPKRQRVVQETQEPTIKLNKVESTFDLARKLVKILQENQSAFRSERESNGLAHRNVIGILGHISVNLRTHPMEINTTVLGNPLGWLMQSTSPIAMAPFFTPNHVSLLCKWGPNRVLHLDASHSLHTANYPILEWNRPVSLTCVPYQLLDETNVDENLAGGNCAMFTGLNAIACVLRYREEPVRLQEFATLLEEVLQRTPPEEASQIRRMTMRNILYLATERAKDPRCVHLNKYGMPPAALTFPLLAMVLPPDWVNDYDFSADFVILSYFRDTSLGFHQVSLLGNVFRVMLQDMVERGFVSFRISCNACQSTQVAGNCSACYGIYCSRECMATKDVCHKF